MLIGLLTPTAGTIELDGVDVIREPRRVRDRIGYMGQKVSLYQGLSLRENVEFYAGLYGLGGGRARAALGRGARALRARARRSASSPRTCRPACASAPASRSRRCTRRALLFLDEPTAGVDVESRGLFWELIQDEADAGVTVFVTTHFLEEADYCDWVAFIDAGRLVADTDARGAARALLERLPDRSASAGRRARARAGRARAAPASRPRRTGDRLRSCGSPALDSAALARLARVLGPESAASVRIEQASMTDVFRRLVRDGARAGGAR